MPAEPINQSHILEINGNPVPLWFFIAKADYQRPGLSKLIEAALAPKLKISLLSNCCRGVNADRLPVILATGCSMEPSNAPFFAGPLRKALEYGCTSDQVIQMFRPESLEPSWRECPAHLSAAERNEIEAHYPTMIPSVDATHLWFTRFQSEDTRAATDYERIYGYWIPGDSGKALAALILISENPSYLEVVMKSNSSPL